MKHGIILLPLVALRSSADEEAELDTQLLYGEVLTILEEKERWLYVQNFSDSQRGWVDIKTITAISAEDFEKFAQTSECKVYRPLLECGCYQSKEKVLLPGGSIIHDLRNITLLGSEKIYHPDPIEIIYPKEASGKLVLEIALQYLNAPYLWGGKSIMGIDCSGLVQIACSVAGIRLPRFSAAQAQTGETVHFLTDARTGDLAFFGKESEKITHVGILLNNELILHASGWVKIEKIDSEGIISKVSGKHTHNLRVIKRII
jgi:hypothetical protein